MLRSHLSAQEGSFKLDVDHLIPLFLCHFIEHVWSRYPCVVHQNVNLSKIFNSRQNDSFDICLDGHVSFNRHGLSAHLLNHPDYFLSWLILACIVDDDICPFLGEGKADGPSNPSSS